MINLSPAVADELGLDPFLGPGALISAVGRGFAVSAGFRPGDLIRSVNGRRIESVRDLNAALETPGRGWQIVLERNGQTITANF
nr:PDZ domain-containing protein [Phenylobacterium sp. J426]